MWPSVRVNSIATTLRVDDTAVSQRRLFRLADQFREKEEPAAHHGRSRDYGHWTTTVNGAIPRRLSSCAAIERRIPVRDSGVDQQTRTLA
jgi:hypothetical protein